MSSEVPKKKYDDDKFFAGVDAALHRAARRASEIAARTGTYLVIYKDGKIQKIAFPRADKSESDRFTSRTSSPAPWPPSGTSRSSREIPSASGPEIHR